MPFPTLKINSESTDLFDQSSGAGPTTAIFGTKGRADVNGTKAWIGLYEATLPDLSGVATNGTHVIRYNATSGRRFSKIIAKKSAQQSVTGNITATSTSLTAVDATDMAVDEAIRVAGAGAGGADLYSHISSIAGGGPGSTITLTTAAGTTVTGATVVNPRQVKSNEIFTTPAATDRVWAIGGVFPSIFINGSEIWNDLQPGWFIDIQYPELNGAAYVLEQPLVINQGTTDLITIRGTGTQKPTLKGLDNTVILLSITGEPVKVSNIKFDTFDIGISKSSGDHLFVESCEFSGVNTNPAIRISASGSNGNLISNCYFNGLSTIGVHVSAGTAVSIENCFFKGAGGTAIHVAAATDVFIRNCVFYNNNYGVLLNTVDAIAHAVIENCSFEGIGNGVSIAFKQRAQGLVVRNCLFSNLSGTALAGAVDTDNVKYIVDYNNFYLNAINRTNVADGANDLAVNPQYWDVSVSATNYAIGLNLKAKGWPRSLPGGDTVNVFDIGYAQRREIIGGDILLRIVAVADMGSVLLVSHNQVGGTDNGLGKTSVVDKAQIPLANQTLLGGEINVILGYLRTQLANDLVGKEIGA